MKVHGRPSREIGSALRPWRAHIGVQHVLRWAIVGLVIGLALSFIVSTVAWGVRLPGLIWWIVAFAAAGLLGGLSYGIATRPSLGVVARRVDELLDLSDRQTTAWEMRNVESAFARLQRRDALASLQGRFPGGVISKWPGRTPLLGVLVGSVLVGLALVVPNPITLVSEGSESLREGNLLAQAESRRERAQLTGPDSPLSAAERVVAGQAYDALDEALERAKSFSETRAALSQAERQLLSVRDSGPDAGRILGGIEEVLSGSPLTSGIGKALRERDDAALAAAVDDTVQQLASMGAEELNSLAASLDRAASAARGRQPLADLLRRASKAVASGDGALAEKELEALAEQLKTLQADAASNEAIQRGLAGLQRMREMLDAIEGRDPMGGYRLRDDPSGDDYFGRASDPVDRDGGEGRDYEGMGAGPGFGRGAGGGDQSDRGLGEVTDPLETGEVVFVPGQGPYTPIGVESGGTTRGAPGELRPFREVVGEYARQAREHIDRAPVPPGYKELVRRYFAELAGDGGP